MGLIVMPVWKIDIGKEWYRKDNVYEKWRAEKMEIIKSVYVLNNEDVLAKEIE